MGNGMFGSCGKCGGSADEEYMCTCNMVDKSKVDRKIEKIKQLINDSINELGSHPDQIENILESRADKFACYNINECAIATMVFRFILLKIEELS